MDRPTVVPGILPPAHDDVAHWSARDNRSGAPIPRHKWVEDTGGAIPGPRDCYKEWMQLGHLANACPNRSNSGGTLPQVCQA